MNIDFSKFLFKCDNDDCGSNADHVCCVSCGLFEDCIKNGYVCEYLDVHNNNPEDCPELYLKKE